MQKILWNGEKEIRIDVPEIVTLITGGAGTIGLVCVLVSKQNGTNMIIVNSTVPFQTGGNYRKNCGFRRGDNRTRTDVTSCVDINRIAAKSTEGLGKINILVNNVGVIVPKEKYWYIYMFFGE